MSFTWPWALLALLAIPLILLVAWWSRRRRRRTIVRVTSAALVRAALPGRTLWRRRIPTALLLLGVAVLSVGAARPQRTEAISSNGTTILLAVDVSGSMCSTDVSPNRITAAENAAAAFIKAQPGGSKIGWSRLPVWQGFSYRRRTTRASCSSALKGTDDVPGPHRPGDPRLYRRDHDVDPSVAPTASLSRRARRPRVTRRTRSCPHRRCRTTRASTSPLRPRGRRSPTAGLRGRLRHHHAGAVGL